MGIFSRFVSCFIFHWRGFAYFLHILDFFPFLFNGIFKYVQKTTLKPPWKCGAGGNYPCWRLCNFERYSCCIIVVHMIFLTMYPHIQIPTFQTILQSIYEYVSVPMQESFIFMHFQSIHHGVLLIIGWEFVHRREKPLKCCILQVPLQSVHHDVWLTIGWDIFLRMTVSSMYWRRIYILPKCVSKSNHWELMQGWQRNM